MEANQLKKKRYGSLEELRREVFYSSLKPGSVIVPENYYIENKGMFSKLKVVCKLNKQQVKSSAIKIKDLLFQSEDGVFFSGVAVGSHDNNGVVCIINTNNIIQYDEVVVVTKVPNNSDGKHNFVLGEVKKVQSLDSNLVKLILRNFHRKEWS